MKNFDGYLFGVEIHQILSVANKFRYTVYHDRKLYVVTSLPAVLVIMMDLLFIYLLLLLSDFYLLFVCS